MRVVLPQGKFTGKTQAGIQVFHGIPYTRPFKRFELPQPPEDSDQEFSATEYGPSAPQRPSRLEIVMGSFPPSTGAPDEHHCGVLSVYTPDIISTILRSVIVFMHGGAFLSGTSQTRLYEGVRLARDGDVVVMCINYRLGVLGFLYDERRSLEGPELPAATANMIKAFEWVHKNIAAFGGDADNVTAFGQSAGGYHIQCLLDLRPELFHRAILQSSPINWLTQADRAEKARKVVLDHLADGVILQTAEVKDLLAGEALAVTKNGAVEPPFCPTADKPPGRKGTKTAPKDILVGTTANDGLVFSKFSRPNATYDELDRSIGDRVFKIPQLEYIEYLRSIGHRATGFQLTWAPEGFPLGADHCTDLPLVFGDEAAWKDSPMIGTGPWSEWERRGKRHREALAEFAQNGTVPAAHDGMKIL